MRINEIFYTLQGEGFNVGKPAIFVRTAGCNLRCNWCDTKYASWFPEGNDMTVNKIVQAINDANPDAVPHNHISVVITGGEPMIHAVQLADLVKRLRADRYQVTIETAGTIYNEEVRPTLWSLSPKLAHSAPDPELWPNEHRMHIARNKFRAPFAKFANTQYKFVVRALCLDEDLREIAQFVETHQIDTRKVMLMGEGMTTESAAAAMQPVFEACMRLGYRMCPRLHVLVYGNKRGV